MKFQILLSLLLFVTLVSAVRAENFVPPAATAPGVAMIVNTGKNDAAGYRIAVSRSGEATALDGAGRAQKQLPANMVDRFFHDISAAMPLSKLPGALCTRTALMSFPTFVVFQGQSSDDLSCQGNDKSSALWRDVQTIAQALYVSNYRVRTMKILFGTPEQQTPAAPQTQPASSAPNYPSGGYGHMHH